MDIILTCNECGTPHYGISRAKAKELVKYAFKMRLYEPGMKPNIDSYEHCSFCGNNHKNFTLSDDEALFPDCQIIFEECIHSVYQSTVSSDSLATDC